MFNLTPTVRNLLLANILVYLLQVNLQAFPVTEFGSLYPLGSPFFHFWQFLTYMFLHGSWWHLLGNMFGLVALGPMLEQRWGGQRFLAFWLMCGVGAGVLYEGVRAYELTKIEAAYQQVIVNPSAGEYADFMEQIGVKRERYQAAGEALQRNPNDQELRQAILANVRQLHKDIFDSSGGGMLGASGALFGIMFAFAYLFPNTILMLIIPPIPMKAKYFVLLYGLFELYNGVHQAPGDTVAHFAHLGGLLVGFIIIRFWEGGRTRFY